MPAKANCPLCNGEAEYFGRDPSRLDTFNVECQRCGRYRITSQALTVLPPEMKFRLSAFCRRAGTTTEPPTILSNNIGELVGTLPTFAPLEKLDNVLLFIAERTAELGQTARFNPLEDYPLLICSPDELLFLAAALKSAGFIADQDEGFVITMPGWHRVQQIQKSGRESKRAFVAMWFDSSMDDVYEKAIVPGIMEAGYLPLRIDKHPHVNRIDDEIIGQIKRCRFMVADFTGQRHSVYFEAGMMIGLGRNVIWMCREDALKELRFDVRQFSFIVYKDTTDAKKLLFDKILAIEGEGPTVSKA